MASISLQNVSKIYPTGLRAVNDVSLDIQEGEFMVLVGPSGCGKTTLMRMIAGLETVSEGKILIGPDDVTRAAPKERDVAMVFQNYALYPHMTVADNIGFPMRLRKIGKAERSRKVAEAARILGLTESLGRRPPEMSGGQRQRVAMGRAIVRDPKVFLMDEPLSNLDAKLRVEMRSEILRIQRRVGVATVYVTHDQTEAMTMGDRVAVIDSGRLQQCASPQVLYDAPENIVVAAFIGSPPMNLFAATVADTGDAVELGPHTVPLPATRQPKGLAAFRGKPIVIGIRPEDLSLAGPDDQIVVPGKVELIEALGAEVLVHFSSAGTRRIRPGVVVEEEEGIPDAEVSVRADWIARLAPRSEVATGDNARFALDLARVHYFDPESGAAIR